MFYEIHCCCLSVPLIDIKYHKVLISLYYLITFINVIWYFLLLPDTLYKCNLVFLTFFSEILKMFTTANC